jgi:hypothetical protein
MKTKRETKMKGTYDNRNMEQKDVGDKKAGGKR